MGYRQGQRQYSNVNIVCLHQSSLRDSNRWLVNLLIGEDAKRSIGLVARIVRHPLAPKVVAEDVSEVGARSDVRVVDDRPHIVVYQLPAQRVAVAQRAKGGQHRVAERSPLRLRSDSHGRVLVGLLLPTRCCHVVPGFPRSSTGLRMKLEVPGGTSISAGRLAVLHRRNGLMPCAAFKCGWGSSAPKARLSFLHVLRLRFHFPSHWIAK